MKEIWVLTVRTSLPETCERIIDMPCICTDFENFEKAKGSMRKMMNNFAFMKSAIFDGEGRITELNNYINDMDDDYYDDDLSKQLLITIQNALIEAFAGRNTVLEIKDGSYADYMIGVDVSNNSIRFYGEDDGPDNGYDPVLQTNIFSMEKEQDYYFYIDPRLGQSGDTAELYIDLKKATIEE